MAEQTEPCRYCATTWDDCEALDDDACCLVCDHPVVEVDTQPDPWRAVAIALHAELAEHGYDPNSPAVRAYHHARNGRWDQPKEALS